MSHLSCYTNTWDLKINTRVPTSKRKITELNRRFVWHHQNVPLPTDGSTVTPLCDSYLQKQHWNHRSKTHRGRCGNRFKVFFPESKYTSNKGCNFNTSDGTCVGCRHMTCRMPGEVKSSPEYEPHTHPCCPYLFHIKDDNEFQGCNCREKRWEKGSNPANGLPIDDPQDVIRNGKFLLSPALNQLPRGTVGHQEPGNKWDNFSCGLQVPAKATEPCPLNQSCFYTYFSWKLVSSMSRRCRIRQALESWRPESESQIYSLAAK